MTADEYVPDDEDIIIAYRFISLGLMRDPNDKPHDPEAMAEADAEYRRWIAAHDARVHGDGAREALDGLAAWMSDLHDKYPSHAWYVPLSLDNITRYTTDNYPEETL